MSGWVDAEYSSCWDVVDEDDSPPGPNSISCEDGVGALHISREVSIKGGMYYIYQIRKRCNGVCWVEYYEVSSCYEYNSVLSVFCLVFF